MVTEHKIEIIKRDHTSRQGTKQLRRDGNIPGIYYAATLKTNTPFYITQSEYHEAVKSGARIFNIFVNGEKQNVLFKSVQYHPVTEKVIHIDLYGVRMDQVVNVKVMVKLSGDPIGVKEEGGVLSQATNEIEIQCLPGDIPEFIVTEISALALGDSINVGSIPLDEKFNLVTSEETVLASVTHAMKEVEPVIEVEEDEAFLDEDGVPIKEGETEEDKKSSEDSGEATPDKEAGSK